MISQVRRAGSMRLRDSAWPMRVASSPLAQVLRRQVDRDAHVQAAFGPDASLTAGAVDHPVAQAHDQAEALGQRDEDRRRHVAARRVAPAQQGLGRGDAAAGGVDLGLEHEFEAVAVKCLAEVAQQLQVVRHVLVHLGGEHAHARAAGALGGLHRGLGAGDQALGVAVVRVQRDAHRARQVHLLRAQPVGLADGVDRAFGQSRQRFALGLLGQQHREHVAARARQHVLGLHQPAQAPARALEQLVADEVAVGGVDGLEAVEVDEHQRQALALGVAARHGLGQARFEGTPRWAGRSARPGPPSAQRPGARPGAGGAPDAGSPPGRRRAR